VKYLFLFIAVLLLQGCSPKEEFRAILKNDTLYTNAMAYTKKATLKEGDETVVTLTATYLNKLYPSVYNDAEYLFVGIHVLKDENELNKEYILYLEEFLPTDVKTANLREFRNLPLQNSWSSYYVVSFTTLEKSDLTFRFGNETLGYTHFTIVKDRDR
jgi:hypothetical protein